MKKTVVAIGTLVLALWGCGGDGGDGSPATPTGRTVIALVENNGIVRFNAATPTDFGTPLDVTGVRAGESLVAIDRRPATGVVYAVSSEGTFYTLNLDTGAATLVGSGNPGVAVQGSVADVDFNPVTDQIRVATTGGQNFRVSPTTGQVTTADTAFNYDNGAPADVYGLAYTNAVAGARSTTLYGTSEYLQVVRFPNPNSGTVEFYTNGQRFSTNATDFRAFDISPDNRLALLGVIENGSNHLLRIDLASGEGVDLGPVPVATLGSLTILN